MHVTTEPQTKVDPRTVPTLAKALGVDHAAPYGFRFSGLTLWLLAADPAVQRALRQVREGPAAVLARRALGRRGQVGALAAELEALAQALAKPAHPVVAIVGGSKVSTKLTVLESLAKVVDQLVVGGGIANTFLAAAGKNVGKSLCEHELLGTARELAAKINIPLPTDVVVGAEFSASTEACLKPVGEVQADDMIFDIGPQTSAQFAKILQEAKTIIWNGPVGVFEFEQFSAGTQALAEAIASSEAFSIAGGGDTLAAIDQFGVADQISYISTGGGAFLEFVEGKVLPAVAILEARAQGSA